MGLTVILLCLSCYIILGEAFDCRNAPLKAGETDYNLSETPALGKAKSALKNSENIYVNGDSGKNARFNIAPRVKKLEFEMNKLCVTVKNVRKVSMYFKKEDDPKVAKKFRISKDDSKDFQEFCVGTMGKVRSVAIKFKREKAENIMVKGLFMDSCLERVKTP